MHVSRSLITFFKLFLLTSLLLLVVGATFTITNANRSALPITHPTWSLDVPAKTCPGATFTDCHYSSPVIADISGDGLADIIVATNKGHVIATRHNGQVLWNVDTAPLFGMAGGSNEIASSPVVADIDDDGNPEIVIGSGTIYRTVCTQGGVIVLNHNGNVEPGWPQFGENGNIPPDGCKETFFATPAVGDIDNDGDMEIVAGGFDHRIMAWHHDGSVVEGFSPPSHHYDYWADIWGEDNHLKDHLSDTVWGSAALADIDLDGYLDMLVPTDEGYITHYNDGWVCDFAPPPGFGNDYCGGSLYALDRFGEPLPGFPVYIKEVMSASPAVADVDGDGVPEIIAGTGTFYHNFSPDNPTHGFRIHVLDNQGNTHPAFSDAELATDAPMPASPAVGDITGDGRPEIIAISKNGTLYAWKHNGSPVNGFPMAPIDHNQNTGNFDVGGGPILADYDDDGKMEIIINIGWSIVIVDGDGDILTGTDFPGNTNPIYFAGALLLNTPAMGDINGDSQLDLVTMNSQLDVWLLDDTGNDADWPMWRGNPARDGSLFSAPPHINLTIDELTFPQDVDDVGQPLSIVFPLNVSNSDSFSWNFDTPNRVTADPATGSTSAESVEILITVNTAGLSEGTHYLGDVELDLTAVPVGGGTPVALNAEIPVTVIIADFTRLYLPTLLNE